MKFIKKILTWIKTHKLKAFGFFCLGIFSLLVISFLTAWGIKIYLDSRIFSDYDASKISIARTIENEDKGTYVISTLVFKSQCTERDVPVIAVEPKIAGRKPVVIILYGMLMKADFIRRYAQQFSAAGLAVFTMDYYDCGMRRGEMNFTGLSTLQEILKIPPRRERIFREWIGFRYRNACAVTELRQLIDVIKKRPGLDSDNICVWGISLGTIIACNTGALCPDIKKFIFMIGSADFPQFAVKSVIRKWFPSCVRSFAPALAAEILSPLDPVNTIGKLSPRPILFQNSINDDLVPRECTEKMYECAGFPKSQVWYKMGHMRPNKQEVQHAIEDGIKWLKSN
jgi:cephalosporin-C deacetylase-like acetyl esterase